MKTAIKVKIQARLVDAKTGWIVKALPWKSNLIYDAALTALATGAAGGFSGLFLSCKVGNGTLVNSVGPGAVTFIATGSTLTASQTGWFNTNSVPAGWLMKLGTGTGGVENYIASLDGTGTVATMVSAYVGTTTGPATAWNVAQTTLPGYGCGLGGGFGHSASYGAGSGTQFSSNQITLTRVFNFAQQGSNYTVTAVGYASADANSSAVNGAVNISPSLSVLTTQFLQVQIQVVFTQTPGAITAVSNVTTGINTAGNVAFQTWDCTTVNNDGTVGNFQQSFAGNVMDFGSICVGFLTSAITLNTSIQQTQYSGVGNYVSPAASFTATGAVGVASASIGFSGTTAGETINALAFGGFNFGGGTGWTSAKVGTVLGLNLTTGYVLPVGAFSGTLTYTRAFTRTLTN